MKKLPVRFLWSMVALALTLLPLSLLGKKTQFLQVTDISAAVTPTQAKGECPQQFLFAGRITANGKGVVKYRWERSDGVIGPLQTLPFTEDGTQIVTTIWELGETGDLYSNYWQVLQILSPQVISSNEAVFTLDCRGKVFTKTYKDIDVCDIYLDNNCRLWVKHFNRGTESLKVMVREKVWIDDQLADSYNETLMLEPGAEIRHKVGGEPGFMVLQNAKIKVQIDTEDVIDELNEKNNIMETRVYCKRESNID